MRPHRVRALFLPAFLSLAPFAGAQWSADVSLNLSVGDGPGDQVQPKLAPTADGGTYVSWFDGIASGYDVRLQRLDVHGVAQWAHRGVLVADRSFSSTQDYGLALHASGDALLAFRDDRSGTVQVTAQRVRQDGSLAWGTDGIQLTNTNDFLATPRITGTSDGEVVVSWMQAGVTYVARLDADGVPVWANPVALVPGAGSYTPSDLHAAGTDAILSIVHQTGSSFGSPRHLVAQKFDASGAATWGAQPLVVFDGGSLQIGNFPTFVPDGSGGALFAWYAVSPLQVYAQRVLANGSLAFPANGVSGSTDGTRVRVSPAAAFDPATSDTYLFWREQNALQSQSGLYGQRLDATGARQWGASGIEFVPLSTSQVDSVRCLLAASGAYVFWTASPAFGQDTGQGTVVQSDGTPFIPALPFASTPSAKSRLFAARGALGHALLAWSDGRNDGGDVLAQNFDESGSVGPLWWNPAYCAGSGCPCGNDVAPGASGGCVNSGGAGARLFGEGFPFVGQDSLRLRAAHAIPGQAGLFFQGNNPIGGGAGTPFGDGLRCAGGGLVRLAIVVANAWGCAATDGSCGTPAGGVQGPISLHPNQPVPLTPGTIRRYQYWYRDPVGSPCGGGFNFTDAVEVLWL